MTIKHVDTLGWAGFVLGVRVTEYYRTRGEAEAHAQRAEAQNHAQTAKFNAEWARTNEAENRKEEWLNSLMKHKNIHFKGSNERHFDRKLWNAYCMRLGGVE